MAEIIDLLGSQKVKEFVRKEKSRPWTVLGTDDGNSSPPKDENVPSTDQQASPETEANSSTNRGQTEAKPGTEPRPNRGQIEAKKNNEGSSKPLNRGQTEAKLRPEPRPLSRPIRGQIEAKPGTELRPKSTVFSLDGLQREILLLIFNHCKRARTKQTPPIAIEHISESCKTTYHAARKAIQRLEQKDFLKRAEFKVGRSGWTKYEIPDSTYQEILQNETEANSRPIRGQTEAKPGTELRPEPRPSLSSSSSSLLDLGIKKLTSTSDDVPEWDEIDISPLTGIRFTETHLKQIASRNKRTAKELQDSIHAFAFDLEVNGKGKTINSPLHYFMKILNDGPYAPSENYESPAVRQKRIYLEAKEKELRTLKEIEEKIETVEFERWAQPLSLEKRAELVPPKDFAKPGGTAHTMQLRTYFRENVWPQLRERVLKAQGDGNGI